MASRRSTPEAADIERTLEEGGKAADDGGDDLERKEELESLLNKPPPAAPPSPELDVKKVMLPALLYISTSASLILLNKHALGGFNFSCPNALLAYHCGLAVVLVKACELLGFIKVEPLRWHIVKLWFPVNLIFVGMLASSFFALSLIGVGMFTILKNLSNLLAILGDYFIYKRTYGWGVWGCMVLMIASAAFGGYTDARFSAAGYSWQLINCVFTSAYALYLTGVMDKIAPHTGSKQRLSEFSMVYYNNLLSLGPLLALMAWFGEFQRLPREAALRLPAFQAVATFGGLLGFGISFTSLWYVSRTTATIYSLTGSLNKILVAIAGIIVFREATNAKNLGSIVVGLLAGTIFVMAKNNKR